MFSTLIVASLLASAHAQGSSTFSPARPPAIPLAVKSPYLSGWLPVGSDGGNGGYLAGESAVFWNGQPVGWTGLIRVDGVAYTWMGNNTGGLPLVTQDSFEYTATRSIFKSSVNGVVDLTITFLSPITPDDYTRGSLISSYLEVDVASADGQTHQVELYTDITAEWISGDREAVAQWDYGVASVAAAPTATGISSSQSSGPSVQALFATRTQYEGWTAAVTHTAVPHRSRPVPVVTSINPYPASSSVVASSATTGTTASPSATASAAPSQVAYHKIYRQTQLAFSEVADQTEYGYWYYMVANTTNLSHQSGSNTDVRGQFATTGALTNTADTNYRAINDSFPTFGFALELGSVGQSSVSTLFTINLNQENALIFEGANGNQTQPSLWTSYFASDLDADTYFYSDYAEEQTLANTFDSKVESDSTSAGGANYSLITTLSARQAFGALQLAGTPSATYLFMKEISSDGNVNTVDVIFPWHPIALYTNPTLLKLILEPLFINQEAGNWPFAFSIHDIGSHYPNATGHNDGNAEQQPLEECGNMIIMSLAYAQRTDDNAWLASHYTLLNQWVGYLIQEALIPANQISTDDFAGSLANQTNLALKGIIGIQAMSEIANRTDHPADAANYSSIASSYISQWIDLATTTNATLPHTTLNYGNESSYGLLYNLYNSRLLSQGDFVPQEVYDRQSAFYPTVANTYGVPLDTRHSYTKLDWELFCAAIANADTKDLFINDIASFINSTPTDLGLTDLYDTITGEWATGVTFIARPVIGGSFALLALPAAPQPT